MGRLKIPLLDLRAQDAVIGREVRAAVERVLETQEFVLGVPVAAFEREMAEFCGTTSAVGVASGTDALYLALGALGAGPRTAVITTSYSFIATATAIVRLGARPIFVDIDPRTLNLDIAAVRASIDECGRGGCEGRLVGIVPVHLFGGTVALGPLLDLAREHDLFVVEDAAQAIGATVSSCGGRRAGSLGDAGCLSFYPTKNLGGLGDGGMVLTSRSDLAERLRSLRVHGAVGGPYRHEEIGLASRLDALQAAALSVKLPHVDEWNAARRQVAGWYAEAFEAAGLIGMERAGIGIPQPAGTDHVFHQYVVRVPEHRDRLRAHLDDAGIGTQVHYPVPLPQQPCLAHLGHCLGDFPEAERASKEILALPMYPELERGAVDTIVGVIADYFRMNVPR